METIPEIDALALFPMGRPSNDLEPVVEMIASWTDPFSQRALLIGVSGCHAILLLGSDSERMSSRIGSLGTDEIRKCPWVCAKDHRASLAGVQAVVGSNPVIPIFFHDEPFGEHVEGISQWEQKLQPD
jgi:hypothetical protein